MPTEPEYSATGGSKRRTPVPPIIAVAFLLSLCIAASLAVISVGTSATPPGDDGAPTGVRLPPIAKAFRDAPVGSLGPSGTTRERYRYYDSLFHIALQFGAGASTAIEVGCSADPFVAHLGWIDRRTCLAPYFVDYGKERAGQLKGGHSGRVENVTADFMEYHFPDGKKYELKGEHSGKIETVTADFMEYQLPDGKKYDLLLCSQVLEHVDRPKEFMQKLVRTANTSIISVPYKWPKCTDECHHVSHQITYDTLLKWSSPYVPIYSAIVTERTNPRFAKRIVLVYQPV